MAFVQGAEGRNETDHGVSTVRTSDKSIQFADGFDGFQFYLSGIAGTGLFRSPPLQPPHSLVQPDVVPFKLFDFILKELPFVIDLGAYLLFTVL